MGGMMTQTTRRRPSIDLFRVFTQPWASDRLDVAREQFRAGQLDEKVFRATLAMMGYTRVGIDAEVRDQLALKGR